MGELQTREQTQERAVVTMGETGGLCPTDFNSLWRMAEVMAASGMMPKGLDKPEQVFVAMEMGLEVGLKAMQSVQNIAVINGRPSLWGDAMLGLVEGSGLLADFQEFYKGTQFKDDFTAVCIAKRAGRSMPVQNEFSVADAKAAGLWGKSGPWTTSPKRMLKMRARSFTLRDGFADVLKGLRAAEEIMDIPNGETLDVTPVQPEPPAVTLDDFLESFGECDKALLKKFTEETAEANGILLENLMLKVTEAEAYREEFFGVFTKWADKQAQPEPEQPPEPKADAKKAEPEKGEEPKPQGPALASADAMNGLHEMLDRKKVGDIYQMDVVSIVGKLQEMDGGDLTADTCKKVMAGLIKKPMVTSLIDKALKAS